MTSKNKFFNRLFPPVISGIILCILWEDLARISGVASYVLPKPSDVLIALSSPMFSGESLLIFLFNATLKTGAAALLGFLIASILGVILGTILASVGILRRGVYPLANLLQMVPIIALAPLLNIWFGYGIAGVSAAACIVSIFPVIANTVDGLRSVDPRLVELFEVYGATPSQRWRQLELPAALPSIFTGLRVAAGLAVIGAVVGELVSGILDAPPIGAVIATNLRTGKLEVVFAAVACSAIVGFGLFGLVSWLGQRALGSWHASSQREQVDVIAQDVGGARREQFMIWGGLMVTIFLTVWAFQPSLTPEVTSSKNEMSAEMERPPETETLTSGERSDSPSIATKGLLGIQRPVVRVQLNWMPEPEFGGIYAAQLYGYDRQEGIDLEIISGGPGVPSPQLTASGKVEFGVVGGDQIVGMRAQGAKLIAIYASFNTSPRALISHLQDAPQDLESLWKSERTIAVEAGSNFVKWLNHVYGGDRLSLVSAQGGIAQFKRDPTLSQAAFIFSEPVTLSLDGVSTQIYPVAESGYNPYAVIIATREEYLKANPVVVSAVRRALRRGWETYLKSPEATNRALSKLNPSMSLEAMNRAITLATPYIRGEAKALGDMSATRWKTLAQQMKTLGMIKVVEPPNAYFWPPHN